jgi:hypothetical protein
MKAAALGDESMIPLVPGNIGDYGRIPRVSPQQPVVLGGLIEVRSQGFAMTVPPRWYAFDLTNPGLVAEMETFDQTTRELLGGRYPAVGWPQETSLVHEGPSITMSQIRMRAQGDAMEPPDAFFRLVAVAPWEGEATIHECSVASWPDPKLGLDRVAELSGESARQHYSDVRIEIIQLPAGRAVHTSMSGGGEDANPASSFELVRDGWFYSIECVAPVRHDPLWRSIAASFEPLGGRSTRIWRRLMSTLLR